MIPNVDHVIVVAILSFGIYAFLAITGVQMRWPGRRSNKTAESIYLNHVDSDRRQHRDPRQHGETWTDAEGSTPRRRNYRAVTAHKRSSRSPLRQALHPGRQRDGLAPVAPTLRIRAGGMA